MLRPYLPLKYLPSGLVVAKQRVTSAVAEYATAEGAMTNFAFMEGPMDDSRGKDLAGTRVFGDESEITRSRGTDAETRTRFQRLELTFRVDNLIGEVTILDYTDEEPDVRTVEQLAEMLLSRIKRELVNPGPRLSPQMLRIEPLAPWVEAGRLRDFYTRIDRYDERTFAQVIAAIRDGQDAPLIAALHTPHDELLPIHTYMFWSPIGDGDPLELPLYVTWLDHYETPGLAATALNAVSSDLGPGYVNVHEFTNLAEPIGHDSRMFAYAYAGDGEALVHGHVVMALVGSMIVRVQADALDGVRRAGVEELAKRQVACVYARASCEPIPITDALDELMTDRQ